MHGTFSLSCTVEMSSLAVLALALLAALASISKKILIHIRNPPKNRVPLGPRAWPIIGNLYQLGPLPHVSLHGLAQKYGEIMQLKYGLKTVVVATSPRMAEEFLKTHDHQFASKPPLACGHYTGYHYQDVLSAPYGPHWRKARKIYTTKLFNAKTLDSLENIRLEERRGFFSRLYAQRGKPVVLKAQVMRYTLSSMCRMVLGHKYYFGESDQKDNSSIMTFEEIHGMIDEWMVLNGVLNIGDWIPWLRFFDLQGYVKRMKILHNKFERFYNYVLADHRVGAKKEEADKNSTAVKGMLDALLDLAHEDTDPEIKLTLEAVKALVHETPSPPYCDFKFFGWAPLFFFFLFFLLLFFSFSGTTIEWAIHELLRHPHVYKKAREELDKVIGRERWVQEDDYPQLPYMEAIIKETLRLHPLSPLLPPRFALEDCNVAGYDIAKGTTVLINSWSIGRHPDYWDAPYEFKPERFLQGKEIPMLGQDFTLLPFGSGRRRCPGYRLGLKIVRTTVSNLMHGFDWNFPEGMKAENICMVEHYSLTMCPEVPITVILEPRLPAHLYQ